MGLIRTAPPDPVVSLEDAKAHLRVDGEDEDAAIEGFIAAATALCEQWTGRSLGEQTWELSLRAFRRAMDLPFGPVREVLGVTYFDPDGIERTLATTVYETDLRGDPARVVLRADQVWPNIDDRENAVIVEYTAGYTALPTPIRQAILLLVGEFHAGRENSSVSAIGPHSPVATLLHPYRDRW